MKNKKYLLLLLAVLMAFTLVFCTGCKDDPDEPPLTESPVTTEEPDTAEPDTAEPDTALPDTAQPETDAITTAEPETSEETDDTPSKPNNPSKPSNPTTPDNPPETSVTKPETQEPSAPVYTVVFDTDASGASYSTKSVTTQGAVVFPETPTRSGYTFKGWYTAKNGSGTRLTSGTTVASNTTYYALWSEEVDQRPDRNVIEFSTYDEYSSRAYPLCEEMGFDYIWYRWDHKNEEASIEGLNELYSYGIKACIIDDDLKTLLESGNSTKAQADALTKNYINSPAYWGNWLVDEPGSGPIHPLGCKCRVCGNNTTGGQLLTAIKAFMEYYPDKYFQLNLLPIYAWVCGTPQQLAEAYKNFKDYAGIYADESNVNLVMQDTYPHGKDGKNNVVANHYLLGLSVTAEAARDNNAAHGVYIKTLNEVTQPPITEKSIRFEAFTGLAYGTSKISFFISTSGASGLMTEVGKNATFAYAQEMISDLHSISSVYSKYDWQAA